VVRRLTEAPEVAAPRPATVRYAGVAAPNDVAWYLWYFTYIDCNNHNRTGRLDTLLILSSWIAIESRFPGEDGRACSSLGPTGRG
jgi:hypothetical protein